MKFMDSRIARFFIQTAGPLNLLGGILMYALGVGISRYLGHSIDWAIVALGQVWVTTYQIGSRYLSGYFFIKTMPRDPDRVKIDDSGSHEGVRRDLILWAGFASFAAMTSVTLILMQRNGFGNSVLIVITKAD